MIFKKRILRVSFLFTLLLSLSLVLFLDHSVQAKNGILEQNYEELITLGIVDGIATPYELGLDYLEEQPIDLDVTNQLMEQIGNANRYFLQMPENIALAFPLGTNSPIEIGTIPTDDGSPADVNGTELVGYINNEGHTQDFTPADGVSMTETEYRNNGNIVMTPEAQHILLADARGDFLQSQRFPVFDIVVRDVQGHRFLVPNVNANAICRDAINAFLNGTFRRI